MTGWGRWSRQGFSNSGGIKEAFCLDDPINPPAFPAAIFSMLKGSKQAQNCKAFGLGTHSQEEMDAVQTWAVLVLLGFGASFFFNIFLHVSLYTRVYLPVHLMAHAVTWSHSQGHLCSRLLRHE